MLIDLPILIFALLGIVFLGLFTYFKNPKSSTNAFFFLFTVAVALYLVINYLSLHQDSVATTFFFIRTTMFVAAFINLFFLLLADSFPNQRVRFNKPLLAVSILITAFIGSMAYTNLIFQSVTISTKTGNIQPVPGVGMPLFLLHTLTFLGGGFVALIRKLKTSTGIAKAQIRLFLLGGVVMFVSILVTNLFLVLVFNTSAFVGLLPIYILMFVSFISYAIIKHRFLDIGLLVARSVTYAILIFLIAALFSLAVLLGGNVVFQLNLTRQQQVMMFIVTLLVTLVFQSLRRTTERLTNKALFKNRYRTHEVLGKLSKIMASSLRLDDLTHGMLDVLVREVHITQAAFILLNDSMVVDVKSEGFRQPPTLDEREVKHISKTRDTLVFDDLEEGPLKSILRKLGFSVVVHLRTEGKQIGLLVIGEKKSGDIFSEQDLSLVEILAPEAAVAIQNSQSYEEIRRFNITLQEEVERATADLQVANKKLIQVDKMKDEFVSLASHELRTPMTAIKSYTWMVLNNKAGELTPKGREYLDIVFQSTERLIRLVNEMLNISRIESGRIQMKIESFDLFKLLSEIKEEFAARIAEKQLTLEVMYVEKEIPMTSDRGKILQIFENLIGNATKFTPARGKITVTASTINHQVTIAVADTGRGIKPEDLDKLFQKFGRLEQGSLTSIAESGTGLGLYLSKQYAQLHGGDITVASEFGKGTTFTVTLPLIYKGEIP